MGGFGKLREPETFLRSLSDELRAVELALRHKLDIDDAIQYAVSSLNAESIVSFDKHFEDLETPRKDQAQILSSE